MSQSNNSSEPDTIKHGKPLRIEFDTDADGGADRVEDLRTIVSGRHTLTGTENDGTKDAKDAKDAKDTKDTKDAKDTKDSKTP